MAKLQKTGDEKETGDAEKFWAKRKLLPAKCAKLTDFFCGRAKVAVATDEAGPSSRTGAPHLHVFLSV